MYKTFSKEMMEQWQYYVYIYVDPDTLEIFYVGKGNRAFSHLEDKSDTANNQG
ncbi:hypothetical protein HNR44_003042 [Geomicrobium halophilum]|uniref:GIY-YIG domain-containing protein n=1 Tax=Geomicrobium halophilum TaxID=549000 RepID=A0A841Q2P7_9BACL|nr:hypothetical protein [Geomicrobium halophilum]MBB6451048.1 hypothetical protein [Geomicrobium halophilum]